MFIFGCQEHEVASISARAQEGHYPIDARLQARSLDHGSRYRGRMSTPRAVFFFFFSSPPPLIVFSMML